MESASKTTETIAAPEVASILREPGWKVVRWIQSGRLEGAQTHGRWWATPESVELVRADLEAKRQAAEREEQADL